MAEAAELVEDYKIQATALKESGNNAYKASNWTLAIDYYSQAITIDPDDHVLYSNRSAAYMKADSKSKALWDAQKCVELQPEWPKGYSRLGAALHGLQRFEPAMDAYKKGLELEPDNALMQQGITDAREGYEAERKIRYEQAAKERAERAREQELKELSKKQKQEENLLLGFLSQVGGATPDTSTSTSSPPAPPAAEDNPQPQEQGEEDLLASFLTQVAEKKPQPQRDQRELTAKYMDQELGTPQEIVGKLLQNNHQWKNLNPYYVLDLDIDATDEDIKQRYRKLSAKIHPDKLLDMPNAREAFEEVKKAYQMLQEEEKKELLISVIQEVRRDVIRTRKKLLAKGMRERDMPPLEDEQSTALMKHFATMELHRLKSQQNQRSYAARERKQEDEVKERQEIETEFEQSWTQEDRRDKRVGNWRDFAKDPAAKRSKASNYKEETRAQGKQKFGNVKLETWKKNWK